MLVRVRPSGSHKLPTGADGELAGDGPAGARRPPGENPRRRLAHLRRHPGQLALRSRVQRRRRKRHGARQNRVQHPARFDGLDNELTLCVRHSGLAVDRDSQRVFISSMIF